MSGPSRTQQSASQATTSTTGTNAPVLSGKGNALNYGLNFSNQGDVNLSTDAAVVDRAFGFGENLVGAVGGLLANVNETNSAAVAGNNALLAASVGSLADLGKSNATGGQSDTNKTFLYLGIAAAVIVALFFFWRR